MDGRFSTPVSRNGNWLVLSIDDEPLVLYTRQKLLEAAGYDVLSAIDGEQALRFFAAASVDLVVLDYAMPGMNGAMVAQEMKARRPLVPVMLVSAALPEQKTLRNVDCFVRKAEGPALLLEKIRQLLVCSARDVA